MPERHPSAAQLIRLLKPNPNLAEPMHGIAVHCSWLMDEMLSRLGDGPEFTAGLRKLLEAKDCFVRQALIDTGGLDDQQ